MLATHLDLAESVSVMFLTLNPTFTLDVLRPSAFAILLVVNANFSPLSLIYLPFERIIMLNHTTC